MKIDTYVKYKYSEHYLRYIGDNMFKATHKLHNGCLTTLNKQYI